MQPVKKFTAGAVQASVWKSHGKNDKETFSVSIDKRYKDKDGEWKESKSLKTADLPKAALVLNKAFEYLVLKKDKQNNGIVVEEEDVE